MSIFGNKDHTEKYHLAFVDPNGDLWGKLSFNYLRGQQFYILDEVGEIADFLLKDLLSAYPNYKAIWTRDISVHELTYYEAKTHCDNDACDGCVCCAKEICCVYFYTDDYVSNWYFQEHFSFLIDSENG